MDTYGDTGGYGDVAELYGGGGSPPDPPDPGSGGNRMGGTGAVRKPPR